MTSNRRSAETLLSTSVCPYVDTSHEKEFQSVAWAFRVQAQMKMWILHRPREPLSKALKRGVVRLKHHLASASSGGSQCTVSRRSSCTTRLEGSKVYGSECFRVVHGAVSIRISGAGVGLSKACLAQRHLVSGARWSHGDRRS